MHYIVWGSSQLIIIRFLGIQCLDTWSDCWAYLSSSLTGQWDDSEVVWLSTHIKTRLHDINRGRPTHSNRYRDVSTAAITASSSNGVVKNTFWGCGRSDGETKGLSVSWCHSQHCSRRDTYLKESWITHLCLLKEKFTIKFYGIKMFAHLRVCLYTLCCVIDVGLAPLLQL